MPGSMPDTKTSVPASPSQHPDMKLDKSQEPPLSPKREQFYIGKRRESNYWFVAQEGEGVITFAQG